MKALQFFYVTRAMVREVLRCGGRPTKVLVNPVDREKWLQGFSTIEGIPIVEDVDIRIGQSLAVGSNGK